MNKQGLALVPVLALLLTAAGVLAQSQTGRLVQDTSGGVGLQSNTTYILDSILGQVAPGHSSNRAITLDAGFWYPGQAALHPTPSTIFLPLVTRNYSQFITVDDAPGQCPGRLVELSARYREDLDAANDNDWYRFTAQAGRAYSVRASDLGARADTILTLYAPDCATKLAENDDAVLNTPSSGSLIEWTAPAAGVYHIMVRGYDWRVYGDGTGYSLLVTGASSAPGANLQQPASSNKPIPLPTPVPGGRTQ